MHNAIRQTAPRVPAGIRFIPALVMMSLTAGLARAAAAQMPSLPTLQNAWANAGFVAGINGGTGGSGTVAAAVAWAPGSGRFQLSAGAGVRDADERGRGGAYGLRGAMPIFSFAGGALGVAGFIGVGGASEPDAVIGFEEGGTLIHVPIGIGLGYRRALDFLRGVSVYASPYYSYNRLNVEDFSETSSLFRIGLGVDVGVTNSIGVTLGSDFGSSAGDGEPGPDGAMFGVGASYAFGRR